MAARTIRKPQARDWPDLRASGWPGAGSDATFHFSGWTPNPTGATWPPAFRVRPKAVRNSTGSLGLRNPLGAGRSPRSQASGPGARPRSLGVAARVGHEQRGVLRRGPLQLETRESVGVRQQRAATRSAGPRTGRSFSGISSRSSARRPSSAPDVAAPPAVVCQRGACGLQCPRLHALRLPDGPRPSQGRGRRRGPAGAPEPGDRTEDQLLVQLGGAAVDGAADQVGVAALQLDGLRMRRSRTRAPKPGASTSNRACIRSAKRSRSSWSHSPRMPSSPASPRDR